VSAAAIDEAAAIWLLRLEAPDSAQLQEAFKKWLDAEPRHRAAFLRLRCAWRKSDTFRLFRPADGRVDEDLLAKVSPLVTLLAGPS
jgi:transmembrane sensor